MPFLLCVPPYDFGTKQKIRYTDIKNRRELCSHFKMMFYVTALKFKDGTLIAPIHSLTVPKRIFAASLFSNISDDIESNIPAIGDVFRKETTDEILDKYADISLEEFKVTNNGYLSETSLDITEKKQS